MKSKAFNAETRRRREIRKQKSKDLNLNHHEGHDGNKRAGFRACALERYVGQAYSLW